MFLHANISSAASNNTIDAVFVSYIPTEITHILKHIVVSIFFIVLFYRPIYIKI